MNPDAFLNLYHYHNKNFYAEAGFDTYKGWLVLAADGSDINIPTTPETLETYGSSSRKGTKPQAAVGLGCLYDVMNRTILENDCSRVKFDEMKQSNMLVEIPLDKSRIRHYEETPDGERMKGLGKIALRMVRVELDGVTVYVHYPMYMPSSAVHQ